MNVFVLLGSSGSGKSTLLQKKYMETLQTWNPNEPVPFFMNLSFEDDLQKRWNWLVSETGYQNLSFNIFSGFLKKPVVLFLDSFDEVGLKINFVEKLFEDLGKNPLNKCVICCRSELIQNEEKDFIHWFLPQKSDSVKQRIMKRYIAPLDTSIFDYENYFLNYYRTLKVENKQTLIGADEDNSIKTVEFAQKILKTEDLLKILEERGLISIMNSCYMIHLTLEILPDIVGEKDITSFTIYEKYVHKQWMKAGFFQNLSPHEMNLINERFFKFIEQSGIQLARLLFRNNSTKVILMFEKTDNNEIKSFMERHHYDCYLTCHENPILSRIIRGLELVVEIRGTIPHEKIIIGFSHDMMKNHFLVKGILEDMTMLKLTNKSFGSIKDDLKKSNSETSENSIPLFKRMESFQLEDLFYETSPSSKRESPILSQRLIVEDEVLIRFLAEIVSQNSDFKSYLFLLIDESRFEPKNNNIIASSNAITILIAANVSFANSNLTSIKICGANIRDGNFNGCDFTKADLTNVNLENCQLENTLFHQTILKGINLGIYPDMNGENRVKCCCFSPKDNGALIAAGLMDGWIKIWERTTGKQIAMMRGNEMPVNSIVFSHDGTQLLTGGNDYCVRLWRKSDFSIIRIFDGHTNSVKSVAFSPQKILIISGSVDQTVKIWEKSTGKLIKILNFHTKDVNSVAFSPSGEFFISGSSDKVINLYEKKSYALVKTFDGHQNSVSKVIFSPDNRCILSSSADNTIKLWDTASGNLLKTFIGHSNIVNSIDFSSDGSYIVSGSNDNTINLWETKSGKVLKTFIGHYMSVKSVSFSPNGTLILSGSIDGKIKLWDKADCRMLKKYEGHEESVKSIAFAPDGLTIVSGSVDKSVRLWDKTTGKLLKNYFGHKDQVNSVTFSPKGFLILSGSYDKSVKLWEKNSAKLLLSLLKHNRSVNSVDFSPDESLILSGSDDETIKLWDRKTGDLIKSFELHSSVNAVCFSPDGKSILCGLFNKYLDLFDVSTHQLVKRFDSHENSVRSVAFSPKNNLIVSGSTDRTVKLWDIKGFLVHTFNHNDLVHSVAFSPNVERILSASDRSLKLWDVSSKSLIQSFEGHQSFINEVAFSNDGSCFASCSGDKTIKIWEKCKGLEPKHVRSEGFKQKSASFIIKNEFQKSKSYQEFENNKIGWDQSAFSKDNQESFICNLTINLRETPLFCKDMKIIDPVDLDVLNEKVLIQRGAISNNNN